MYIGLTKWAFFRRGYSVQISTTGLTSLSRHWRRLPLLCVLHQIPRDISIGVCFGNFSLERTDVPFEIINVIPVSRHAGIVVIVCRGTSFHPWMFSRWLCLGRATVQILALQIQKMLPGMLREMNPSHNNLLPFRHPLLKIGVKGKCGIRACS